MTVSRLDLTNCLNTVGVDENMAINHKAESTKDDWLEVARSKFTIAECKQNRLLNGWRSNGKYCTEESSCSYFHAC